MISHESTSAQGESDRKIRKSKHVATSSKKGKKKDEIGVIGHTSESQLYLEANPGVEAGLWLRTPSDRNFPLGK